MNYWTELSVEYANNRAYLDDLFRVYPTIPQGIRDISEQKWAEIEEAFNRRRNVDLLSALLDLELFPVKDSYVAYLRKDPSAIERNPATVNRLSGRLYEMGLGAIHERSSEPKETNRRMGQLFRQWLRKGVLGVRLLDVDAMLSTTEDAILDGSDRQLRRFAEKHTGYSRNKGLDFVGRFNGRYIVGEAKFLTDFGGHQQAQFEDAVALFDQKDLDAVAIAILDGVLYMPGNTKMRRFLLEHPDCNVLSALVLRDFLYQI